MGTRVLTLWPLGSVQSPRCTTPKHPEPSSSPLHTAPSGIRHLSPPSSSGRDNRGLSEGGVVSFCSGAKPPRIWSRGGQSGRHTPPWHSTRPIPGPKPALEVLGNAHLVDPVLRLEPGTVSLQCFGQSALGWGGSESEDWGGTWGGDRGRGAEGFTGKEDGWGRGEDGWGRGRGSETTRPGNKRAGPLCGEGGGWGGREGGAGRGALPGRPMPMPSRSSGFTKSKCSGRVTLSSSRIGR